MKSCLLKEEEIFIPDDIHEEDLDSLNFDEVQFSVPEITFVDDQNPVASPLMIETVSSICEKCGKKYKREASFKKHSCTNKKAKKKSNITGETQCQYLNIKQIFDKKNRISKASSNIIKARLNNFRYPIFRVEYLFYRLPKLRNR